ncbi:hypothetical protein ACMUMQ_14740 [Marinomonas sp. 2405UD66-6]|uniref:hypothetical protein n=1 Tax=Marinomonas sp. 2405UD66-6 TaxID=3391834 RepID=UPI0039C9CF8D
MKRKILPWAVAILCAVFLHLLFFLISPQFNWFKALDVTSNDSRFELQLLPNTTQERLLKNEETTTDSLSTSEEFSDETPSQITETTSNDIESFNGTELFNEAFFDLSTENNRLNSEIESSEVRSDEIENNDVIITKPSLLDLSSINFPSSNSHDAADKVFSPELREKIAASEVAQQEYLKGQIKKIDYPVTTGPDGARYVNIDGVCWRIPAVGSDEPWAVVFAGCTGKSKTFLFELNIAPSVFLGTDSPFSIEQLKSGD